MISIIPVQISRHGLFTIMRNIFINNYRRKAKQKTIFDNTPEDYLINLKQSTVSNAAESGLRIKEIKTAIHRFTGNIQDALFFIL